MKKLTISFLILLFAFFILQVGEAQVINVPGDYTTIQEGIAAANPGDTVLVADGLYYENIDFLGKKPLMVASHFLSDGDTNHINNTIINGSQPEDPDVGSVVYFHTEEDTTSVLCGFTITGGTGTIETSINYRMGGGVHITYCGAKLIYNHIQNNNVSYDGGVFGGAVQAANPISGDLPWLVMRNNRVSNNSAISSGNEGSGGGIACFYNLILVENEIYYNMVNGPVRCDGGGVSISAQFGPIQVEIRNNKIRYNKAVSTSIGSEYAIGGGFVIAFGGSGTISGNDISFNEIESAPDSWGQATGALVQQINADEFVFENNFITNNTYHGMYCLGGGLLLYDTGGKFQNNVIRDNPATHGGGIAIQNCTVDLPAFINNTVTGNSATTQGGGLYLLNANAVVMNTIIWNNTAPEGASIYQGTGSLEVRYSDVEGDDYWPGEGNENVDPGFGEDGYHLGESSMLWNEGIAETMINGITYVCPGYDIDGEPMPWGNTDPEIGADETPSANVSVEESAVGSSQFAVGCYPNPTKGSSQFAVRSSQDGYVTLKVYDVQGREVAVVIDQEMAAGEHTVRWDAGGLPAGVYFYRLAVGGQRSAVNGKLIKY